MKPYNICYAVLLLILSSGCADIKTPTANYVITHPLSTKTMVTQGTTKEEVLEKWGEPSFIEYMGFDDMGFKKEAWTYKPWFPDTPLDYRHFSRAKCIYFTGDYVTGFKDIEEGKDEQGEEVK
jgi:hypothetical protein